MFLRQYVCHCIIFCIQNIQKAPSFPPCVDASKPSSRFWNANVWAGCTKKRARLWWRQPSPPKGMVTRPRAARHKTGLRTGANAPAFCAIVLKGTTDWASHSVWARPHCHCLSITVECKTMIFFGRVCYCEQSMQTPHIHLYTPKQIQTTPTAAAFLAHLFKSSRRPNNIANLVVVDVVTGASSSCWVWAIRRRFQSIGNQLPQASSHRKGDQASCTIHLSLLLPLRQVSATSKKPLRISQNCSSSRVPSFRAWMVWKKLRNRHLCHNLATHPPHINIINIYQYMMTLMTLMNVT